MTGPKPSVKYWGSRKGYMCKFKGKQYLLCSGPDDGPTGPTYLKALEEFTKLLKAENRRNTGTLTVREVLERYLKFISKKKKPGTVEIRQRSFEPFANHRPTGGAGIGEKSVESLTHVLVYDFLEHMETVPRPHRRKQEQKRRKPVTWGPGSHRNFVIGINAAFNWAVRSGLIARNPLQGIDKPAGASRGAEALLGTNAKEIAEVHERIMEVSRPHWRPFIQALKDTGARPGELAAATAADFKLEMGAFVFHKDSNRRLGVTRKASATCFPVQPLTTKFEASIAFQLHRHKFGGQSMRIRSKPGTFSRKVANGCLRRRARPGLGST